MSETKTDIFERVSNRLVMHKIDFAPEMVEELFVVATQLRADLDEARKVLEYANSSNPYKVIATARAFLEAHPEETK